MKKMLSERISKKEASIAKLKQCLTIDEKREFENVLCSLKEESRKKENEIYFLKMELKRQ